MLTWSPSFNSRTPGGVRRPRGGRCRQPRPFQFTHPGRGATAVVSTSEILILVSIHAPREGCDRPPLVLYSETYSFNSRTPGGVRLSLATLLATVSMFQFTHPGRGATTFGQNNRGRPPVSIHAPREGCDKDLSRSKTAVQSFNSRTPGGVRPNCGYSEFEPLPVSIHAPREGCDSCMSSASITIGEFQFTHPGRGATHATA